MDLSIIIPCYNCEKTILKTLDALLVQKDDNYSFEIIAVDNNSNDNTKNLLLDYKSKSYPDLNYVFEPNPGSANARNAGFREKLNKWRDLQLWEVRKKCKNLKHFHILFRPVP